MGSLGGGHSDLVKKNLLALTQFPALPIWCAYLKSTYVRKSN